LPGNQVEDFQQGRFFRQRPPASGEWMAFDVGFSELGEGGCVEDEFLTVQPFVASKRVAEFQAGRLLVLSNGLEKPLRQPVRKARFLGRRREVRPDDDGPGFHPETEEHSVGGTNLTQ
jgi:hypothetical protein